MRRTAVIACCLLVGCGEPLATGDYLGEPLLSLEGNIYLAESDGLVPSNLSVALFWTDDLTAQWLDDSAAQVTEQNAVTTSTFPARYHLTLFEPPSPEVLREIPDADGQLATAVILVYSDLNLDGRLNLSEEPVVGGSLEYIVAFSPNPTDSELLGGTAEAGYRVMRILPDDTACDADGPLAALRPATERTEIDLIVGPDVRDQLPDVDCDGEVSPWLVTECGPIVVSALGTQSADLWEQLQRAYDVCLALGEDPCSELGRAVMEQPFARRRPALGMEYLECAGLLEPDPCVRFEVAVRSAPAEGRVQALAELAACASRNHICERLEPYVRAPREAVPRSHSALATCIEPLLGRDNLCAPAVMRANTAWESAVGASEAVETCLASDLPCTSRQVAWREQSVLAVGQYRRVAACVGSASACTSELASRDRAHTETERLRAELERCLDAGDDNCRSINTSLNTAESRLATTQGTYETCLRENATATVCLPQLESLQAAVAGYTQVNQLRVECHDTQ